MNYMGKEYSEILNEEAITSDLQKNLPNLSSQIESLG